MKNKILILLFTVLVLALSVMSVSATEDANQTLESNVNSNTQLESIEEDVLSSTSYYVDGSLNQSGTGSQDSPYKSIGEAVNASSDGDTIYINSGTYFGENNVLLDINKQLTLTSYGTDEVILDATYTNWIWHINANGVVINGITFINANSDVGSALYYESGSDHIINNSKFINNTADKHGGAIYFNSVKNLQILNTLFENNQVSYASSTGGSGGAIYSAGPFNNSIFKNLVFKKNSAYKYGGAFDAFKGMFNCSFEECKFYNNSAENDHGGAVQLVSSDNCSFNNCIFEHNTALYDGGAIYFTSNHINFKISNSNFTNNIGGVGGAINVDSGANNEIVNSIFTSNLAKTENGGAIYTNIKITIENSSFTDNIGSNGGAIYLKDGGTVTKCNFTDNLADADNGGAIYLENIGHVDGCIFMNNLATNYGGGVYLSEIGNVTNSIFTNNTSRQHSGGAVYFNWGGSVKNCTFKNNTAGSTTRGGGAIYFADDGEVLDSNFTGNSAYKGGSIYLASFAYPNSIKNCVFLNNRAKADTLTLTNNNGIISLVFTGHNNYLNAIYSINSIEFENITYWGVDGIMNTENESVSSSDYEAGQIINITINNTGIITNLIKTTNTGGRITLNLTNPGNYTLSAYHPLDNYYTQSNTVETSFNIEGDLSSIVLIVNPFNIIANVTENASGNVTFTVLNHTNIVKTQTVDLTDSTAVLNISDLIAGEYNITAVYNGDKNFYPSMNNTSFIFKYAANLNASAETAQYGDNATIIINLPEEARGNVTITLNNSTYIIKLSNKVKGTISYNISGLKIGTYTCNVNYTGDENYLANTTEFTLTVDKSNKTFEINIPPNIKEYENIIITIKLGDDATGYVTASICNYTYYATVVNGTATINISGLSADDYTVSVNYSGDDNYLSKTQNATLTVFEIVKKSFITIIKTNSTGLDGILIDEAGNKIAAAPITVSSNSKTFNVTTLDDGSFTVNGVNGTVNLIYNGDDSHNATNMTIKIPINVIIKYTSPFTRPANDYYAGERGYNYTVRLTDINGKVLANKTITFILNDVKYSVVTDKNGYAGLQINLRTVKQYTFVILFAGDEDYNTAFVSAKLTLTYKKLKITAKSKKFKAKTKIKKYKVVLKTTTKNKNGKYYLKAGKILKLKINGKTYQAKTNSKGEAVFKIKKLTTKKKYKAKITYAGDSTYAKSSKTVNIIVVK